MVTLTITNTMAEMCAPDPWTFGINVPPPPMIKAGSDEVLLPLPRVLKFSDDGRSLLVVYFQHGIVWVMSLTTGRKYSIDHCNRSWLIESLQPEWTIWPTIKRA